MLVLAGCRDSEAGAIRSRVSMVLVGRGLRGLSGLRS